MPRKRTDKFVICRDTEAVTYLEPGLFPAGRQSEWTEQNRTLTFSIHPLSNQVAIAVAGKQPSESLAQKVPVYEQDQVVHICGLAGVPDNRLPFVNDTHAVFRTLQKIMETSGEERVAVGVDSLLRMSALYREAMLRQIRVLQEASDVTEFIAGEVDTFHSMHAVWHLLEIIYLTTNLPGLSTSIVPHFMEWLNLNFPAPLAEDGQRILANADLALNTELWPYMRKLALRGHVSVLANMLERVGQELSASAARWARDVAKIARNMPLGSSEETAGSFNARWRRWNEELQNAATAISSLLPSDDVALEPLSTVVDIMRGDADAISAEGESWQDILGALLLYSEPTSQADRLPSLAGIVVEQFQAAEFSVLDRALVALLSYELPEFLVFCNQIDPWLSAHMADLMDHISILDVCRAAFAVDPREHYLLALGEMYVGHENLWRVGLDYFGLGGVARCVMAEYAMRIPLESDAKARQVLGVCREFGLAMAVDRIHRQLGRQQWRRGRLGAAIAHFAEVSDRVSIGLICDQLWDQYLESGVLAYGPVIDSVLAAGLSHDRLQFLTRYRDFHESYKAQQFVDAGGMLLSILVSEIAPPHAVADLLVDAIPLLEGDVLVFSADQTLVLMRYAEALQQSPFPTRGSSRLGAVDEGELNIFNVACARNLARSFLV
ncbi:hypothetical protein GGH94_004901 [Coemansia aciculifera]|uniref:Nuclear pore complex protein Nup85 n=1 Tax=Coemansia aciculifera TaxID=417176 RepID=A0A9W8M1S2_9FUNG|nr:hypothetical protein GGH94_004901 [Coemansia aciculifera]